MSLFGDRLRALEDAADAFLGRAATVRFERSRRRPEASSWRCWLAEDPEISAEAETGHAAMERLQLRIETLSVNPG